MIRTRLLVGLTVLVLTTTPLLMLSILTYGYRYGIITGIYNKADVVFPALATFFCHEVSCSQAAPELADMVHANARAVPGR